MTQKIYRSSRGKAVDIGSLRLQNEHVRAVGNMGVNARGDRIDASGNVIDSANDQLQRRMQRQTNVSDGTVHSSTRAQQDAANNVAMASGVMATSAMATAAPIAIAPVVAEITAPTNTIEKSGDGLAAAIARSKTVKQELEKSARQKQQDQPVRKI
jgi:hypothetical protein